MKKRDRSKKFYKSSHGQNIYLYDDHPIPMTRRQLLSAGVIGFSGATVLADSLPFSGRANPSRPLTADVPEHIPMMVFDMAGGASIPGNFLVGLESEGMDVNLLPSYSTLGWDPRSENTDFQFGAGMASSSSQILQGILSTTSPEARLNLRMSLICNRSEDDTSANELSIASAVSSLGNKGVLFENGVGLDSSLSGGNSRSISQAYYLKPLVLTSSDDLVNSISLSGYHLRGFSNDYLRQFLSLGKALGDAQLDSHPDRTNLHAQAQAALERNKDLLEKGIEADPRLDSVTAEIFAITRTSSPKLESVVDATVTMNTLKQNTGPGILTLGGCDYHDGSRTTGDQRDLSMGMKIGRAVQLAYRLQVPLFFQLITDGGVGADPGTRFWGAESGIRSGTVMGYFNPRQVPELIRAQLGSYSAGQAASVGNYFGPSPSSVAGICLANYLNIIGRMDLLPRGTVPDTELNRIICFARTA